MIINTLSYGLGYSLRFDKAVKDNKSYCVNKDRISTLPRCGGNDKFRPSVIAKKRLKGKQYESDLFRK